MDIPSDRWAEGGDTVEMTKMEKVLHGLSSCGNDYGTPNICEVTECPYRKIEVSCVHSLAHDAMMLISELLKAQVPRVLTLDEVKSLPEETDVWLELSKIDGTIGTATTIAGHGEGGCCSHYDAFKYSDYNKTPYGWRLWTERPSKEQMAEAKWDDVR